MEVAQVFAVNKADLPGADTLAANIHSGTALGDDRPPEIVKVVATEGNGVEELLAAIRRAPKKVL
jgi:LAO/AO transport system kinase